MDKQTSERKNQADAADNTSRDASMDELPYCCTVLSAEEYPSLDESMD